jgi:hypothetical protein
MMEVESTPISSNAGEAPRLPQLPKPIVKVNIDGIAVCTLLIFVT